MSALELLLGLMVCGAVGAAYFVGKGGGLVSGGGRNASGVSVPRTAMEFTYRNASGHQSAIQASIVKVQLYPDGRLSLLGLCGASKAVREFRVDRIVQLVTKTGQAADLATVLTRDFGIPSEKVTAALGPSLSPDTCQLDSLAQIPAKQRFGRQP